MRPGKKTDVRQVSWTDLDQRGLGQERRRTEEIDDALVTSLEEDEQIFDHHTESEDGAFVVEVISVELKEVRRA
jgi:hypothetical protein